VKAVFFHPKLVSVIESDLPLEEKVSKLVKKTVHALAGEKRSRT